MMAIKEHNPASGEIEYKKVCLRCRKEFFSVSGKHRYCSEECVRKHNKRKQSRRKERDESKDYARLVGRAYALSRDVAAMFLPQPVSPTGEPMELHHKNLNPFDCTASNLVWLSRSEHELVHSNLPAINIMVVGKILQARPDLVEEFESAKEYVDRVLAGQCPIDPVLLDWCSRFKVRC